MPTGIHLRDVRAQLFDAAERVLLREGPSGLTSRAVTAEADCAKGVLHRHFEDFDAFLAALVLDRIHRLEAHAEGLRAGTGDLVETVAEMLTEVFSPVAVSIVALITFRDELRHRLRAARPGPGIPLATDAAHVLAGYLAAEQKLGRIAPDADVQTLAPTLIGAGHLLFADRTGAAPSGEAVRQMVGAVLVSAPTTP
ncbi:TetR/AcrR family transcriptional regulator [Amycolatopsis rubida]|uniref:DNA-binding transcriptional regulator, AcrR family n=1 Tax=Amycolatopsis rubida TaxID=112413 RepID=A0A1I5Y1X5_9PSEU|nr:MULTISPECIES: TetR/AcrR family transcriptional regulator [Amycolatopsis]MYW91043.1 TetR family transcriptional regulator [Amycolatopsis rubida]NEC56028.1 TetR/AcrR family transcriptional regulator [Amycolatopsis rubida]OAP22161.1 Bacterial regulatory protein, tetR family [Amycolatopsis sp. M39]SFQ38261.1 DNA-binding transcriptional regulator, AcrR family [Amycolatopsis rubida]